MLHNAVCKDYTMLLQTNDPIRGYKWYSLCFKVWLRLDSQLVQDGLFVFCLEKGNRYIEGF